MTTTFGDKATMQAHATKTLTEYLAVSTTHLHDVPSRTDPATMAAEVERLNFAVRACVDGTISPFAHPADFQNALLRERDQPQKTVGSETGLPQKLPTRSPQASELTLAQAAQKMASGELTSEQLTARAIARAIECQPTLNAFIELWAEPAMQQAKAMDKERTLGQARSLLHGIPVAHKDCFEITGHAATIGSRARPVTIASHTAHAVECLNQAGAVTIGTLNMNEMVAGPTGQNPLFGDCCNAIDPLRISGGSSSGSGSAVASGAIFASLGSDTGGSIRLPASFNGLFGLKPTYGRISRKGCFPRAFSLDCVGPLARTAEDCAITLQAVAGFDPDDPSSLNAEVPDYHALLHSAVENSKIAVLGLSEANRCDPEISAVFEAFIARIERNMGSVQEVDFPQLSACYALGDIISKVEAATLHGQWMRANAQAYSQAVYSRTEPGLHVPAARYLEALLVRSRVLQEFLSGPMANVDVLVCPTVPIPTPLRSEADMEKQGSVFNVVAAITRLTRPFSYLGLPVLSMPIGRDKSGMPVGAQIIGKPLAEARLLSFAHQISLV